MNALRGLNTGNWNVAIPAGRGQSRLRLPAVERNPSDRVELSSIPPAVSSRAVEPPASRSSYYDAPSDRAAREKYYADSARLETMAPAQLFDELSSLVSDTHKPLDYDPERYLYPQVDRHKDGNLYCIYSGDGPTLPDPSPDQPLQEGEFNCEHVVPQSWFSKKKTAKGDLHHLFASRSECNSLRGNAQYSDDVDSGQPLIACGLLDESENEFEPKAGKGETARSVLYFLLRYPGVIGDNANEYGPDDLPLLLQWHRQNPPTEYEQHRNHYIEKLQGNRNPLIDFPQLADKIDFARGLGKPRRR